MLDKFSTLFFFSFFFVWQKFLCTVHSGFVNNIHLFFLSSCCTVWGSIWKTWGEENRSRYRNIWTALFIIIISAGPSCYSFDGPAHWPPTSTPGLWWGTAAEGVWLQGVLLWNLLCREAGLQLSLLQGVPACLLQGLHDWILPDPNTRRKRSVPQLPWAQMYLISHTIAGKVVNVSVCTLFCGCGLLSIINTHGLICFVFLPAFIL